MSEIGGVEKARKAAESMNFCARAGTGEDLAKGFERILKGKGENSELMLKTPDNVCDTKYISQIYKKLFEEEGGVPQSEGGVRINKANGLVDEASNAAGKVEQGPGVIESGSNTIKGGLNSVDDIFTEGKRAFDNFDIDNAYVKPKHLSTTGGNGQKFIGASKAEAECILKDTLSNGKIVSITDNGLTKAGNVSYEIVIDALKTVGTKGEHLVKIVILGDGGMLSAYPIK